ncbi:MAG: beta-propeller fold lactonase family protein [Terracidiphilus sp.]
MKFNKSRLLLVCAVSLLAAGVLTACGTATTDFVYVASSKAAGPYSYGEIDVFEINAISGAMRQIPTSPFPSGGRNPVAEAVSSDYSNLYVVNHDDNSIVQFGIGSDGKLYPLSTVNTPGTYPMAVAVNGSNLFIVDTYEPLPSCSTAQPCAGSVAVFPIAGAKSATPGEPGPTPVTNPANGANYWPLSVPGKAGDVIAPTAINVLHSGSNVYVTAYDSSVTPTVGYVFEFSVGTGGALTLLGIEAAGIYPSAIASYTDSTSATYLYVTDFTNGNVIGYLVLGSGALNPLPHSPYLAGNQPSAIVADPSYPFAYVANAQDGNVEAYSISMSGDLSFLGGSPTPVTYDAGLQPVAMGIDPSTSHFLFTVNFLGNDVSDFELSPTAGTLINTQHSPYGASAQPVAVAAIPHGSTAK